MSEPKSSMVSGLQARLVGAVVLTGVPPALVVGWMAPPRSSLTMIGAILVVSLTLTGLVIARSVVVPLRRHVERLAGVADGDLTLRLDTGSAGEIGHMATAANTAIVGIGSTLGDVERTAVDLAESSGDLSELSQRMSQTAVATSNQASDAAAAAEEISATSNGVSRAMVQMNASVREISDSTAEAARVSSAAVDVTVSARSLMEALEDSASDIGNVVSVITSIAEQTDLLALNATIEAARVGEAGKGFAVVANEVKALASQTSTATDEIQAKIEAIQRDAEAAVRAIGDISQLIDKVNETSTTIAGAVEEQTITTQEVSSSLLAVTEGTAEISENIAAVAIAAETATADAEHTRGAASDLAGLADHLNEILGRFELGSGRSSGAPAWPEADRGQSEPTVPADGPQDPIRFDDGVPPDLGSSAPVPQPAPPPTRRPRSAGRLEELDGALVDQGWH